MTDKVDCAIWIYDIETQRRKRIRLQTLLDRVNQGHVFKELKAVRLIKLEEDQTFIMVRETFATEDVWKIGLINILNTH